MKSALIFCNGAPVKKSIYQQLKKRFNPYLIGADGGTNYLFKIKETPEFIIGDLDSINPDVLEFYRKKKVKIIKLKRQNDTDLEKALKLCKRLKFEKIFITNFTGKRFDHTLSNISNALKFAIYFKIVMIEDETTLQFITGKNEFKSFKNELVSILCFNPDVKISTRHLKYPLKNETLFFGERESTSNVSVSEKFEITVDGGFAVLLRSTKNFLKYD